MGTVHMICGRYYDGEKKQCTIGGIQTYMTNLLDVAKDIGMSVMIYQTYKDEAVFDIDGAKIIQSGVEPSMPDLKKIAVSLKKCMQNYKDESDILLFTTDNRILPTDVKRSIAIQHGISWDMPTHPEFSPKKSNFYAFSKVRLTYRIAENLRRVSRVVCVDHNFPNWLRACTAYQSVPLTVIPNFTEIAPVAEKPNDVVNIIFARRFEKYRGTRVFAGAITKILDEYTNVHITVAGSGPDEKFLRDTLSEYGSRVDFITYGSGESIKIHSPQHIAIVPTVGSEGTSLSLLEAMSAQCAVLCTDVGGMSNIILDGYNGLFIEPNSEDLYLKIKKLIDNPELRKRLSEKGYESVQAAFSKEVWHERWKELLLKMLKE